ncbi:MAG: metallophosphoesterase family protein [Firmicutes bacterium]|nr:metallophosphoesterase family protein [Bacillota bacterium]
MRESFRVGVFSDVHGNAVALEAVLADGRARGVDLWLCAGDLVNYGPRPVEAVGLVRDVTAACVAGNRDLECVAGDESRVVIPVGRDEAVEMAAFRWTRERMDRGSLEQLAALPLTMSLPFAADDGGALAQGRPAPETTRCIGLFHGSPWSPYHYLRSGDIDSAAARVSACLDAAVYCFGHTHVPYVLSTEGRLYVNAGSCGKPKDGDPRACYAIIEIWAAACAGGDPCTRVRAEIIRVAYDTDAVAEEITRFGLPATLAAAILAGREA